MNIYAQFEEIESEIKRLLLDANQSVRICVAWINGQVFGPVFQRLLDKGVQIELICNDDPVNDGTAMHLPPGIKRYAIRSRISTALMHNKFCVIDEETVLTGSYNWSKKAPLSFENIVVAKGDFLLAKSFLHEFYDLISFYENKSADKLQRCPSCGSLQFNLGIFGNESGLYNESKVDVWSVCAAKHHAHHVGEQYEQFVRAQLGLDDEPEYECNDLDKESVMAAFRRERQRIERIQAYFLGHRSTSIHAVGWVVPDNFNEHIEWGVEQRFSVRIKWRDMYYRKVIPSRLHHGIGDVDRIIAEHQP